MCACCACSTCMLNLLSCVRAHCCFQLPLPFYTFLICSVWWLVGQVGTGVLSCLCGLNCLHLLYALSCLDMSLPFGNISSSSFLISSLACSICSNSLSRARSLVPLSHLTCTSLVSSSSFLHVSSFGFFSLPSSSGLGGRRGSKRGGSGCQGGSASFFSSVSVCGSMFSHL